eukprot:PhM_4_TR9568/c0_g10_i1/m.38156/K16570/TUBGCP3, GCP3; gamma-tubulin complex component 3
MSRYDRDEYRSGAPPSATSTRPRTALSNRPLATASATTASSRYGDPTPQTSSSRARVPLREVPVPAPESTVSRLNFKRDSIGNWCPPSPSPDPASAMRGRHPAPTHYDDDDDPNVGGDDDDDDVPASRTFTYRPATSAARRASPDISAPHFETPPRPQYPQKATYDSSAIAQRTEELLRQQQDQHHPKREAARFVEEEREIRDPSLQKDRPAPTSSFARTHTYSGNSAVAATATATASTAPIQTRTHAQPLQPQSANVITTVPTMPVIETKGIRVGDGVITEDSILRDILSAWVGVDRGLHIMWYDKDSTCRFLGECPDMRFVSYLQKLQSCAILYRCIRDVVSNKDTVRTSIVQSMHAAVSNCLTSYTLVVNDYLRRSSVNIHEVLMMYRRFHVQLTVLNGLLQSCANLRGGALLTRLTRVCNTGNPHIQPLLLEVATRSLRPWFAQLRSWITEGLLQDSFGEFFIEQDNSVSDTSEKFWACKYKLRASMQPQHDVLPGTATVFSADFMKDVLAVGKTINFVRVLTGKVGTCVSKAQVQRIHKLRVEEDWRDAVLSVLAEVNAVLHDHLSKTSSLLSHFRVLNSFVMLSKGDFVQQLLSDALPTVKSKMDPVQQKAALAAALQSVVRETRLGVDINPNICDRLGISLEHGRGGFAPFTITYDPECPLNNIFDQATLSRYYVVNRFLLRLSHSEFALKEAWRDGVEVDRAIGGLSQRGTPLHQLHTETHSMWQECQHFVQCLQSYVVHSALEAAWGRLIRGLESRAFLSLDEIRSMHTEYIRAVLLKTFHDPDVRDERELDKAHSLPCQIVDELLRVIHKFILLNKSVHKLAMKRQGDEGQLRSMLHTMMAQFKDATKRLISVLEQNSLNDDH